MKILYGKVFGIGNVVMCVPALRALNSMRSTHGVERIDLLVGTHPDDFGALDIGRQLLAAGLIDNIYIDTACTFIDKVTYDVAIMSIPFDGRWKNGTHFNANKVMDERPRPDASSLGLHSWKKHEVEYQMDNVFELGYQGEIPDCSWRKNQQDRSKKQRVFLGVGYKKDKNGFWTVKDWGNEARTKVVYRLLGAFPDLEFVCTGNAADIQLVLNPLKRIVNSPRFKVFPGLNLNESIEMLSSCQVYLGNDTGMAHLAAAFDVAPVVLYFMEHSIVKNPPWTKSDKKSLIEWYDKDKNSIELQTKVFLDTSSLLKG